MTGNWKQIHRNSDSIAFSHCSLYIVNVQETALIKRKRRTRETERKIQQSFRLIDKKKERERGRNREAKWFTWNHWLFVSLYSFKPSVSVIFVKHTENKSKNKGSFLFFGTLVALYLALSLPLSVFIFFHVFIILSYFFSILFSSSNCVQYLHTVWLRLDTTKSRRQLSHSFVTLYNLYVMHLHCWQSFSHITSNAFANIK